jgi:glutathione S-transferase
MEQVLFYGVPHGCSFGSIVALEWLGQPYRLCRIDMLAKDALYARVNPLQQTPALLRADGTVLRESLAILQHIAARDPASGLGFAPGTPEQDQLTQVLAFLHTGLHGAFAPAWAAFKLAEGAPERALLRAMARDKAHEAYRHVEALLGEREWLVGDSRTIADAYLVGIARWGEDLGLFDLAREHPRLHRHLAKLAADPAVAFAQAIEDGRPATSRAFRGHVALAELAPPLAA